MDTFTKKETESTPKIDFDIQNSIYEISGKSVPLKTSEFYQPIINWLKGFSDDIKNESKVKIDLEYFNSESYKWLIQIFRIFERSNKLGAKINVEWFFDKGDEEIMDLGKEFEQIVDLPFKIIAK